MIKAAWIGLVLLISLGQNTLFASASDSLDVVHYAIHLDTMDVVNQEIEAVTIVTVTPKVANLNSFTLDLLKLTIDSVSINGVQQPWQYNDTLLRINTLLSYNPGDTLAIRVVYHGTPRKDPSTFGGFYFAGNYQYNLGVGIDGVPHNFGRAWFPCKDNFTDRSLFDFYIRVPAGKIAVCNGTMMADVANPDGTHTFHWRLHAPIPTYLAGMAVSDYIALRDTYITLAGDSVPVGLYFRQADSARMAGLFSNLDIALEAFETRFGPYMWERVGYVGVPFLGGAMEHATNVAFPINSQLATQSIMAHELAHSWFGNLVTCENSGEMWLNEGFASFCEAVYFEARNDSFSYKNYVRSNHADVLRRAHISDGGYLAVSGVGNANTYGWTVYSKGASVAHTLRKYMGDSAFYDGIKQYMTQYAFNHATSDTLKNALEAASGQQLASWFDGWVKQPGFPHYSIDSFSVVPTPALWDVTVSIRHRIRGGNNLVDDNLLDLTFVGANHQMETRTVSFSGGTHTFTHSLPFEPVAVMQDLWEKNMDAQTNFFQTIRTTGTHNFQNTYLSLNVIQNPDSAFVRHSHHFIAPDSSGQAPSGVLMSNSRYWEVEGVLPAGFLAKGTFQYNGSQSSTGLLDHTWFNTGREDSLVLLYRPGVGHDWVEPGPYTLNTGSGADRKGSIVLDSMMLGQYTLGVRGVLTHTEEPQPIATPHRMEIMPNPTDGPFSVQWDGPAKEVVLRTLSGKKIGHRPVKNENSIEFNINWLPQGVYLVELHFADGEVRTKKLILHH